MAPGRLPRPPERSRLDAVRTAGQDAPALENPALAARAADRIGAVLLVETLHRTESPRYPLVTAEAGVAVVDRGDEATGLGDARFLMDLCHLAVNGEDLPRVIDRYTANTGHVRIADDPARGAPGTGTLPLRTGAEAFDRLPREARAAR